MNPIRLAGPAVEPIPLAGMKTYLRLDQDDEDELVEALVAAGGSPSSASRGSS